MEKTNKKLFWTITMIMLLSMPAFIASLPTTNAHIPPWTIPTFAYVTAAPNPIGIGQTVSIVFWLDIPPPTAGTPTTGDRWQGLKVTITKPDGTTETKGPFNSDPVGSGYLLYTPSTIGTHVVKFDFPGQVLKLNNPTTGLPGPDSVYVNDTYSASSATTQFIVQQESIQYFEETPLPVSYWTRPINENNRAWAAIASDWLGSNGNAALFGATYQKFNPHGWAPSTAHVMWTYPLSWGGIVGGGNAISNSMSFYSGTQYNLKFSYPIIMYGNVYFSLPSVTANTGNGVTCVSLRTGETLWTNPNINSVSFGQLYDVENPNQHGTSGMYLWASTTIRGIGLSSPNSNQVGPIMKSTYAPGTVDLASYGTTTNNTQIVNEAGWAAIDPQTGNLLFNLTSIPSGTQCYGPQGEWLSYNIGRPTNTVQGTNTPYTYLWQWNNTKRSPVLSGGGGTGNYNMSASYDWNVTLSQALYPTFTSIGSYGGAFAYSAYYNATNSLYTNNPTIMRVFPDNLILGQSSGLQAVAATSAAVFGTPDPFVLWAVNLNATRGPIGQVLWQKNYQAPPNNLTVLIGPGNAETNVFLLYYRETMQWTGYDMLTGNYLWGPTASENAWNFYGGTTGLTNPYGVGYGHLYAAGYGGTLYAYDLKTGKVDFTYGNDPKDPNNSTITPQTVYGNYPTQVAAIANNKVYLVQEEHSLNAPAYQGAMTRCVDAFTGKELWKIYGISSWQEQAVADGYYLWLNLNDMQIYCIGPGPSATTVATNPGVVSLGNSAEILGTVTDQSPNIKLKGTAAISDVDQGPWMNYMVQSSIARPNADGVPVKLTAIDSSGVTHDLGTVISDSNGLFHKLWQPPGQGEYTIVANFTGTQSYGPSSAATAIGVTATSPTAAPTETPAPTTTPTITPSATSPSPVPNSGAGVGTEVYLAIAATAVIVAVAAAAIVLRKRK
jgi:hypothetical protein